MEKPRKAPYYVLRQSEDGNFIFTLNNVDGLVLMASSSFKDKARALSKINLVRYAARKAENFETRTSDAGQYYFILLNTKKTEILGKGEMYEAAENALAALSLVRRHARTAKLDDLTDVDRGTQG